MPLNKQDIYKVNDFELWNAFREGDQKAFTTIYQANIQDLYKYGMKFNSNPEQIKDCIQDLFIKIYNNRLNLGTTDNIRLYLLRALKNRLVDMYYNSKSDKMISVDEIPFDIIGVEDNDHEDDWNDIVRKKKLQKSLEALTPRQKEAIYLRFTKEMPLDEISELLDMNYQSVRNLLHRSIEKLRKGLFIFLIFIVNQFTN